MKKDKEILFRIVRGYVGGTQHNKQRFGQIKTLPESYIGKMCIVIPITQAQKQMIRDRTYNLEKAKRFVDALVKNPREVLDSLGVMWKGV